MNLMLSVIFVCITLGLLAQRPGRAQNLALVGIATLMALLYLFQGQRFM
jgi:hypothetical protein